MLASLSPSDARELQRALLSAFLLSALGARNSVAS